MKLSGFCITGSFAAVAIVFVLMTSACSGRSGAIGRMVDELNSERMQTAERQTGLFSGSVAKVHGDTLQITFNLVDGLSIGGFNQAQLPALRQSAVSEFRAKAADKAFAQGLKALDEENMVIKLVWRDESGLEVSLAVDPADVVKQRAYP